MAGLRPYVSRNGTKVMNWAYFSSAAENISRQAQALEFMEEIYAVPIDSQAVVADMFAKEHEDLTPYMFYEAMRTGHAVIAQAITDSGNLALSNGPSIIGDSVPNYKRTRIDEVLALPNRDQMAEGVDNWQAEFPFEHVDLMLAAAVSGNKQVIVYLLDKGVPATSATEPYTIPLHAACHKNHLNCAKVLLASGLDVNLRDGAGGTPLMRASVAGNADVVRWLLDSGADPQIRETREGNYNALEYGAGRSFEVTKMLLRDSGWSPAALMAAASFAQLDSFELIAQAAGLPDLLPLIVDRGSWMEKLDEQHRKAILGAIEQGGSGGSLQILRFLLGFIPSEIVNDEDIKLALEGSVRKAARQDKFEASKLLLDFLKPAFSAGDDFQDLVNGFLMESADMNSIKTARLLLDSFGADVNFLEKQQKVSPLHAAVQGKQLEMVKLLIRDYHANIHQAAGRFANGPTPLWYAVYAQLERETRALLACGGPVESIDPAISEGEATTKIYISAGKGYRAPVRLRVDMDPAWDDEGCDERFLCLEYPDGWHGGAQIRLANEQLKDDRELRAVDDGGFVLV